MTGGHVVEYEIDPTLASLVHHTVLHLIINFVDATHLELVGLPIDHEPHSRVADQWHVNSVAIVEGRVLVLVRLYNPTWQQLGSHRADYGSAWRIVIS